MSCLNRQYNKRLSERSLLGGALPLHRFLVGRQHLRIYHEGYLTEGWSIVKLIKWDTKGAAIVAIT